MMPVKFSIVGLMPDEVPARITGHAIEYLRREDGVYLTVCNTHHRDCLGRRNPCPA